MYCINFAFHDLVYDATKFMGRFESLEADKAVCYFSYDRETGETEIWGNNYPVDELLPLPIYWLEYRLEQNGRLNQDEVKISY